MWNSILKLVLLLPVWAVASPTVSPVTKRTLDGTSSWVYLGDNRGSPEHRASGILYGIPDDGSQIPEHFYKNIGFNNHRTGGGQLPSPCRGWTYGYDEFVVSVISGRY